MNTPIYHEGMRRLQDRFDTSGESNMGYVSVWRVLEEMVADFLGKGMTIPPQVMSDLKSAKTTIGILGASTQGEEGLRKVDQYLMSVESYLVSEGQKKLGERYVDEWLGTWQRIV